MDILNQEFLLYEILKEMKLRSHREKDMFDIARLEEIRSQPPRAINKPIQGVAFFIEHPQGRKMNLTEYFNQHIFLSLVKMSSYIRKYSRQSSYFDGIVIGNRNMVLSVFFGTQSDMTTRLPGD
jgi:hypothetical protein